MFCFQDTEVKPIFNNNKRAVDFLCVFFKLGAEERKSSKWKTKLFLILVFTSTRLNNIILMVPNILFGRKNVFQQSVMIFLLKTSELPSDPSTVSGLVLSAWLVLKCTNYRTGAGGEGNGAGFCSIHLINIDAQVWSLHTFAFPCLPIVTQIWVKWQENGCSV